MGHSAERGAVALRYFLDGNEVTESQAIEAEAGGSARVVRGGSGVVPENLRQPGETREQWLRPWMALETRVTPPAEHRTFHCDRCRQPAMNIDANGLCRSCRLTPPAEPGADR